MNSAGGLSRSTRVVKGGALKMRCEMLRRFESYLRHLTNSKQIHESFDDVFQSDLSVKTAIHRVPFEKRTFSMVPNPLKR